MRSLPQPGGRAVPAPPCPVKPHSLLAMPAGRMPGRLGGKKQLLVFNDGLPGALPILPGSGITEHGTCVMSRAGQRRRVQRLRRGGSPCYSPRSPESCNDESCGLSRVSTAATAFQASTTSLNTTGESGAIRPSTVPSQKHEQRPWRPGRGLGRPVTGPDPATSALPPTIVPASSHSGSCSDSNSDRDSDSDITDSTESRGDEIRAEIHALRRPRTKPWDALAWQEVREKILEDGKYEEVPTLMNQVAEGTAEAIRKSAYFTEENKVVNLKDYQHAVVAKWYGRSNVQVPYSEVDQSSIAPPLIVADMMPMEILTQLSFVGKENKHGINVFVECTEFDSRGKLSHHAVSNTAQQNLWLRTDFRRFSDTCHTQLVSGKATTQEHLKAQHDPYVCLCPGVTMFRGGRDDGYPFLEQPVRARVIIGSLPVSRPEVTVTPDDGSQWYGDEMDQTALLERLNLIGLVALQNVDTNDDGLPILILSALGLTDRGQHPPDAIANSLKHWRRRYARLFHAVFVGCGPDKDLAFHMDRIINGQVYDAAVLKNLTNMSSWHWEESLVEMHINCLELQNVGLLAKQEEERREEEKKKQQKKNLSLPGKSSLKTKNVLTPEKQSFNEQLRLKLEGLEGGSIEKVEDKRMDMRRKSNVGLDLSEALLENAQAARGKSVEKSAYEQLTAIVVPSSPSQMGSRSNSVCGMAPGQPRSRSHSSVGFTSLSRSHSVCGDAVDGMGNMKVRSRSGSFVGRSRSGSFVGGGDPMDSDERRRKSMFAGPAPRRPSMLMDMLNNSAAQADMGRLSPRATTPRGSILDTSGILGLRKKSLFLGLDPGGPDGGAAGSQDGTFASRMVRRSTVTAPSVAKARSELTTELSKLVSEAQRTSTGGSLSTIDLPGQPEQNSRRHSRLSVEGEELASIAEALDSSRRGSGVVDREALRKLHRDKLRESRRGSERNSVTDLPGGVDQLHKESGAPKRVTISIAGATVVDTDSADEAEKEPKPVPEKKKDERTLLVDLQRLAVDVQGRIEKMKIALKRTPRATTIGVPTTPKKERETQVTVQNEGEGNDCSRISILIPEIPTLDEEERKPRARSSTLTMQNRMGRRASAWQGLGQRNLAL